VIFACNSPRKVIAYSVTSAQKSPSGKLTRGNRATSAPSRQRGRPSREEQARRDNLVLDVALAEFLTEGLNGANIETIARKAGVGKSTIYRKHGTKQGLLLAVAERRMLELGDRWAQFQFDIDDPEGTLYRIALVSYREWSGKSMPIYRIVYTEAERMPEIAKAVDAMAKQSAIRPILGYFQQLQDRGVIDVQDVAEAASLFLVVAAGALRSFLIAVELDEEGRAKLARDAVQFFLYGFAKREH
jgi:TetR/AcrR family transcriptional regulator, mexJK operon transcriptional repressor